MLYVQESHNVSYLLYKQPNTEENVKPHRRKEPALVMKCKNCQRVGRYVSSHVKLSLMAIYVTAHIL